MANTQMRRPPPDMRLGKGTNPLGIVTGVPVEVTRIERSSALPMYYFVTCSELSPKPIPPKPIPFESVVVVKIIAKDELDAYRQVMEASRTEKEKP